MTREQMRDIAVGNVERHLGDCFDGDEEPSTDALYDECYTLAFDALVDKHVDNQTARDIAREVATCYAQP